MADIVSMWCYYLGNIFTTRLTLVAKTTASPHGATDARSRVFRMILLFHCPIEYRLRPLQSGYCVRVCCRALWCRVLCGLCSDRSSGYLTVLLETVWLSPTIVIALTRSTLPVVSFSIIHRYVFILRCIAYPFTVALPQDPVRRYLKVTREYLNVLRERFTVRFCSFTNNNKNRVCRERRRRCRALFSDNQSV